MLVHKPITRYEQAAKLLPFSSNHYEHTFRFLGAIGDKALFRSDTEIGGGSIIPGFSWARSNNGLAIVTTKIDPSLSLNIGGQYICLFRHTERDGNTIHIDQALEIPTINPQGLIKEIMRSWRFSFLRNGRLHKWYSTLGEQSLMALMHDPGRVSDLLRLDEYQLSRVQAELAAILDQWHMIRHFYNNGMKINEIDLIIDVFSNAKELGDPFNPFLVLQSRSPSREFERRYFQSMGIYEVAENNLDEIIVHFLDFKLSKTGGSALKYEDAIGMASSELRVSREKCEESLSAIAGNGRAEVRILNNVKTISVGKKLVTDKNIAKALADRPEDDLDNAPWIDQFPTDLDSSGKIIELNEEQKVSLQAAIGSHTSVITGGPGTGKTTVIKFLTKELKKLYPEGRIFMAAPTGKAARRMTEVTGITCQTLHRLLGLTPDSRSLMRGFGQTDTLILDEASMVDVNLAAAAIRNTRDRGKVILLGDPKQIDSVDDGAILSDILMSRHVLASELKQVQRQAAKSNIVMASYQVDNGEMPTFWQGASDLHFIEADSDSQIADQIEKLVSTIIPETFSHNKNSIQILSSMMKGEAGVNLLNQRLKPVFNPMSIQPTSKSVRLGNQIYHVGDRIMQLKNRYDLDIQNGEIGEITDFDDKKQIINLDIDGRIVRLPYKNWPYITHAWSSTIHKSQGSEYDCVIISLSSNHQYMLGRKLLFTAMTRGKKNVFIVGSKKTLEATVKNSRWEGELLVQNQALQPRLTHLPFMIAEGICNRSKHEMFTKMSETSKMSSIRLSKSRRVRDVEFAN